MFKPFIIMPQSEIQKFKRWTLFLSADNTKKCERIILATCNDIVRRAIRFAPVNKQVGQGGFLRASIGTDANGGRMSAEVWAGGTGKGINVKYAPYVEFGTGSQVVVPDGLKDYAIQFKGRGKRKVNNRAQPYFFPAIKLSTKKMMTKLYEMGFK